jgi:2-polyprenyl-6-methoxyphenol hydroxylase-like FAD-dependent oxidoreductase
VHELGIQMTERDLGMRLMSAWRPDIEDVARGIVTAEHNVSLHGMSKVVGLEAEEGSITAVKVESAGDVEVIEASLVIDASGTGSKAPKWLQKLGIEQPGVDRSVANQWYASMLMERTAMKNDNDFWLTFPTPPNSRGGLVSPINGDQWCVSLSGNNNDEAPRDFEGFKEYAAILEDSAIAELLQVARPAGDANVFRKKHATWRRYDQLSEPLTGFLPLGDSVASLNPVFGQGMSVAAWQATELKNILCASAPSVEDLTVAYLRKSAQACKTAWELGNLVRDPDSVNINWRDIAALIPDDPELHRKYVAVWHLIEPVSVLRGASSAG